MDTNTQDQFKTYCDNMFKTGGVNDITLKIVTRVARNLVEMHIMERCQAMRYKEVGMLYVDISAIPAISPPDIIEYFLQTGIPISQMMADAGTKIAKG